MPRFLIADDHPLFREALQGALARQFDELELREAENLEATLDALEADDDLDLLLLDLNMPGSGNLYGLIRVREDYPLIPVAIISAMDDPEVIARCIGFGALGYLPKTLPSDAIAAAIRTVLDGDAWVPDHVRGRLRALSEDETDLRHKVSALTPQQYRVLCHVHDGLLNKQIAWELGITEATVKAHMTAIFRKLDIVNRTQAVLMAERLQLTPER